MEGFGSARRAGGGGKWRYVGLLIVVVAVTALATLVWTGRGLAQTDPVLIAAGDIADCKSPGAGATALLVDKIPGTVITLGDNAYPGGSAEEFAKCYDSTWGRFKDRTRPAAGNHDYGQVGARAYFEYFGAAAGPAGQGWYSYDLGTWHIIVLNSDCNFIGGCGAGSAQEQWLKADLEAHPAECTLAYWHHPLFGSSGGHTRYVQMQDVWWDLYRAGADVILNGHAHNYERLAPIDPKGVVDERSGIRQFIAGTGGRDHRPFSKPFPASEVRYSDGFGVLKMTLHPGSYEWEFIPEAGKTFTDSGSGACH